jgi:acyl-CoA synthetase (AMP-forming)/AMP-acid ligase II
LKDQRQQLLSDQFRYTQKYRSWRKIMNSYTPLTSALAAGESTVGALFHSVVPANPDRIALVDGDRQITYTMLDDRSNRLAHVLRSKGLRFQDRVAILAHNCAEYMELELAVAKAGLIMAALNWRLEERELQHCISLVDPKLIIVAADLLEALERLDTNSTERIVIGEDYEQKLTGADSHYPDLDIDPESGLVILYTSGTTGLPKGALISHRAMIARAMVFDATLNVPGSNNFPAWAPMYHMVSTDQGLATLMRGGTVWCIDGYQPDKLAELVANVPMHWFVMMPGMVGAFVKVLKERNIKPKGINMIGAMADLIPSHEIAEATRYFEAPFLDTFGATETGFAPASGKLIHIGDAPIRFPKMQTPFCDLRLVDPDGNEVPAGEPGEVSITGPMLFSGYWNNNEANLNDFRGGRFHMGDILRRNPDGTLEYVDRLKYMIKSGGENIYPAEIEQVVIMNERVETAIAVRKPDSKWGEVPVLFIVRRDEKLTAKEIFSLCEQELSSYKRPKTIYFIQDEALPRSTTGKIQRHVLEKQLDNFAPELA